MDKFFLIISMLVSLPVLAVDNGFINSIASLQDRGFYNCSNIASQNNRVSDYGYNRLAEAEEYLFGDNYASQNLIVRIERLEDSIFGRRYPNSTIEQRVNNIIYNYNRTASTNSNYKKTKFRNIMDGFNQAFFGVPTGYTPPIYTDPYYNWDNGRRYGSYNDYYGRNGWRRYNSSTGTGSGIYRID